jgi:leader peptidase (prepilin peptidase)/N-methyltransferase
LDLIPLVSFILLAGKCRYCGKEISWQYPVVELVTGLAFALLLVNFGVPLFSETIGTHRLILGLINLVFVLFFVSVLIVISVSDIKWGVIPDKIILPAVLISLIFLLFKSLYLLLLGDSLPKVLSDFGLSLLAALVLAGFFLALIVLTKGRGMGGGDLKLVTFLGLSLGLEKALLAVFLGFLTGAIVSVMLVLLGTKRFKETVAFGPFLALGAFIAVLFGEAVIQTYLKALGL